MNYYSNDNGHAYEDLIQYQQRCPCDDNMLDADHDLFFLEHVRRLANSTSSVAPTPMSSFAPTPVPVPPKPWEVIYSVIVLVLMFAALISERIGTDMVMMAVVTLYMVAGIITVQEGLSGFANDSIWAVIVLFVVAGGISKTGALDWYMNKLLGTPKSYASGQLRLMIPIAAISAFLNNTPVVQVMIPVVQRWSQNTGLSPKQLLIPLSFASILGGTCTLIGTSTNLVVSGMLQQRYPDGEYTIGLFDLGMYGVPVAMAGISYILVAAPFLLPGGEKSCRTKNGEDNEGNEDLLENSEDVLLGARLKAWSPAAGRSVKRSGLRDRGGIYLVSVHRAATGNVHRAVSNDFVLNVGDILYFTGLIETFGEFCEENGLEVVTNETAIEEEAENQEQETSDNKTSDYASLVEPLESNHHDDGGRKSVDTFTESKYGHNRDPRPWKKSRMLNRETEGLPTESFHRLRLSKKTSMINRETEGIPAEIGLTKESLLETENEVRLRTIYKMTDQIRERSLDTLGLTRNDAARIVVTVDKDLVVIGLNCPDRRGLLLDVAKGLLRLKLQLHHTEAAVVDERSISIWRCETAAAQHGSLEEPDIEEIWSVLYALLESESGIQAVKQRGLRVVRTRVIKGSKLIGCTASQVDFRAIYRAAIVAVQQNGKNTVVPLEQVVFSVGDILVLQASDDSPLLKKAPEGFYKLLAEATRESGTKDNKANTFQTMLNVLVPGKRSSNDLQSLGTSGKKQSSTDLQSVGTSEKQQKAVDDLEKQDALQWDSSAHSKNYGEDGVDSISCIIAGDPHNFIDNKSSVSADDDSVALKEAEAVWRDLRVLGDPENAKSSLSPREFLTAMAITPDSKLIGQTVAQAGINKLPGVFLVSIDRPLEAREERDSPEEELEIGFGSLSHSVVSTLEQESVATEKHRQAFTTIDPEQPLAAADVLWFSGSASAVGDLRKIPGLASYNSEQVKKINEKVFDRRLVQAVISRKGPLVGKTVREVRFRTRYSAAVIAIHREGKRIHEHPASVKLRAGDVLLLEAGASFIAESSQNDNSFALLAEVEDSAPPRMKKLIPALIIMALMLIVSTLFQSISLVVAALCASMLMIALGILSEQEARDAINWSIYLTIGAAFGISAALENSGISGAVATALVAVGTSVGNPTVGVLGAIYLAAAIISNVVTNNAAAALLFPISISAAQQTNTDIIMTCYALMLGCSASFMTPFGYTTNLLVYGPGRYKFNDYLVFGGPMQVVLWVLTTMYLAVIKRWYLSWIATGAVLLVIAMTRTSTNCCGRLKSFVRR